MTPREEIDTLTNFYKSWDMGAQYTAYYDKTGKLKVPATTENMLSILHLIGNEVQADVQLVNRIYANVNGYMKARQKGRFK